MSWSMTNNALTSVSAVDSQNRVYTVGNQFVSVFGNNQSLVAQFPTSADQPKLALSMDETVIYFQADPFTVEAREIVSGTFLWNRTFLSLVESIQVFPLGIIVDTLIQLDLINGSGVTLASFNATEGINSLVLYDDRVVLNKDKTVAAYTYDGTSFRELFKLTGEFDYMAQAAGAGDLFFIASGTDLRAFSVKDGTEAWSFQLESSATKLLLGNGTIFVTSLNSFIHISLNSEVPQDNEDPFPLWFLGWIIPLILLFFLFIFFAYRWNSSRKGYEVIQ